MSMPVPHHHLSCKSKNEGVEPPSAKDTRVKSVVLDETQTVCWIANYVDIDGT